MISTQAGRDKLLMNLKARDTKALAQAITLVESELEADRVAAIEVLKKINLPTKPTLRIGITGIPGAGKSTLIDSLGFLLAEAGHRVAVLAIDPSSEKTGGSILADKTRMTRLSIHPNAFIRPSPSRGVLGGVGARSRESVLLCEAADFDIVIVETVGVGQSETVVSKLVDLVVLVAVAGTGDDIQGIKKGILEVADIVAINKADSGNETRVKLAKGDLEMAFSLYQGDDRPIAMSCSAVENRGIQELWDCVSRLGQERTAKIEQKRRDQNEYWLWAVLKENLWEEFQRTPNMKPLIDRQLSEVRAGKESPSGGAQKLLKEFLKHRNAF